MAPKTVKRYSVRNGATGIDRKFISSAQTPQPTRAGRLKAQSRARATLYTTKMATVIMIAVIIKNIK
jgi:hypothetical protein